MKYRIFLPLIVLMLLVLPAPNVSAGELDPGLDAILKNMSSQETVTALFCLEERVEPLALYQSTLLPVRLSSAERHEYVIRTLQNTAAFTQAPLIRTLEEAKAQGQVEDYCSFWITNIVSVTGKASAIRALGERPDVAYVLENRRIEMIRPVMESEASSSPGRGIESGIAGTKAPQLWALGVTGAGVLACNIDTGVDGNHPALASRWHGLDSGVSSAEAWYDPVTHTTFPFDSGTHGTHTMGTICGDDGGSNQIGMAPGAKWIAAATIDRVDIPTTMVDALASFQWCADPDGNPGTNDDVPAVASNSWGLSPIFHSSYTYVGDPYFWAAIDGCEAAGCAVVFAAGNEGYYGSETLRTPADRIDSPVSTFSVGALEPDQATRADFSSVGPSGIDHYTKKPEVMAQGAYVRSSLPGGSYGEKDGTSMACPHVAGAVALLKSAYPEATAFELKAALLNTAHDLGPSGEDNEYGRGLIDVLAAYYWLDQNLITDTYELSLTSAQIKTYFSLHAGAANGGAEYLMLGSFSGSAPGLPLPGGLVLPINWDNLTDTILSMININVFMNFYGTLDGNGNGVAYINTKRPLKPKFIGKTMTYAYTTLDFGFVSDPVAIKIVQ